MANESCPACQTALATLDRELRAIRDLRESDSRTVNALFARLEDRFRGQEQAISKAEHATNERLAGMNEFRQSLSDIIRMTVTRAEFDKLDDTVRNITSQAISRPEHDKLDESVRELQRRGALLDGRLTTAAAVVAGLVSLITSLVILAVSHLWK